MKTLTRDDILRPSPREYDEITWIDGQKLRIQSLTAGESRAIRQWMIDSKGDGIPARQHRIGLMLLCRCIVDEAGNRILSDEDALSSAFDSIDTGIVDAAVSRCLKHTGFRAEADWTRVKDSVKNSESIRENS